MTVSLIGVERALRAMPARVVIAAVALGSGLAVNASFGDRALDRLTPDDVGVDQRVVVIAFDGGTDVGTPEAQYLRATTYRDVATVVERGGAAAVAFVDFDSLTFSDGSAGRSNVIGADVLQRTAVRPLSAMLPCLPCLPWTAPYRWSAIIVSTHWPARSPASGCPRRTRRVRPERCPRWRESSPSPMAR